MNTKRTAKVALATFGLSMTLSTAALAATDTQGHWAGAVLERWESQALISGYEDGTIRPDNEISRAEFVALVNRVAGYHAAGNAVNFSDVKTGDWYAGQVAAAVEQGYIGGYADNTFRPGNSVTRAEAAAIIARVKNLSSDAARAEQFADAKAIPDWAKGVIGAVARAGYMIGDEANQFKAEKALTRAEAVAALDRVFKQTLTLSATEGTIIQGLSKTITVTAPAANAVITATSSDPEVATVTVKNNDVIIKGVKAGNATITVTATVNGHQVATATYQAAVKDSTSSAGSVVHHEVILDLEEAGLEKTVTEQNTTLKTVKDTVLGKIEITIDVPADGTAAYDAVTKVDIASNVSIISVTLPKDSTFVAAGQKVTLTKDLVRKVNEPITLGNIIEVIDNDSKAALEQKLGDLSKIDTSKEVISCKQTGNTLEWAIKGMSAAERVEVLSQLVLVFRD